MFEDIISFDRIIKKALQKKCPYCGAALPSYPLYYNGLDGNPKEVYQCVKCKREVTQKIDLPPLELRKMDAMYVDKLFDDAWKSYEKLVNELKIFCEENEINPELINVKMNGPHVKINHNLPAILWTEKVHDALCETFGVKLTHFKIERRISQTGKPPLTIIYWSYSTVFGLRDDPKFILDYGECVNAYNESVPISRNIQ